jgi:hypothetical protein
MSLTSVLFRRFLLAINIMNQIYHALCCNSNISVVTALPSIILCLPEDSKLDELDDVDDMAESLYQHVIAYIRLRRKSY